jgi:hypothetical protein
MFSAQRRGKPAWNESVHNLHALEVARGCHDVEECAVDRQGARAPREVGGARFANESSPRSRDRVRIGIVHAVDILHDGESSGSKCIRDEKGTRVCPMGRDA